MIALQTTIRSLLKSETPIAVKDIKQQALSLFADENVKWYNHFGRQFVSFKAKHSPTIRSNNHLLGIWLTNLKNYVHTKPAHKCLQIYS